jgi:anaerobic ribonucleoside-triphosphate reductase activating protein
MMEAEFNAGMGKPLKYYDVAVTMSEFPDEIALCVNITGCPCHCDNCSEPWLRPYVGTELTDDEIDRLISEHPGITVFGLMGGDSNYEDCIRVAKHVHERHEGIKVGIYSGRDWIDLGLANVIDLYKIGRWINPVGPSSEWHQTNNGVLQFPWSNQLYFERVGEKLVNATYKFRREKVGNPERYIIKPEDNNE